MKEADRKVAFDHAPYGSAVSMVLAFAIRSSSKQETLTGIPNHMSLLLSIPS